MAHDCRRCADNAGDGITIAVRVGIQHQGLAVPYCAECFVELLNILAKHANELDMLWSIRADD